MTSAFTRDTPANRLRAQYCAVNGHQWHESVMYVGSERSTFSTCAHCHIPRPTEWVVCGRGRRMTYVPGRLCRRFGHSWRRRLIDNQFECRYCGTPHSSPAAQAAPTPQKGGYNTMEISITINGIVHEFVEKAAAAAAAPATLTIKRPFVVYDVNGDRVDGYKYESRARRNNDARFAGVGYWLGRADTGVFEFVSA